MLSLNTFVVLLTCSFTLKVTCDEGQGNFVLSINGFFLKSSLSLSDISEVLCITEYALNSSDIIRKSDISNNRINIRDYESGYFSSDPRHDSIQLKRAKLNYLKEVGP